MDALALLAPRAAAAGKFVSLTISVAFGDPYDGPVDPNRVAAVAAEASDWGVDEVALGDTIGVATPPSVKAIAELVGEAAGGRPVRCHFHDTRGTGLANLYAAMEVGISTFDTSVGGTGGSPFAPDAGGNVATEDALFFLDQLSVGHGRDLDETIAVGRWLSHHLGHDLPAALQRVPRWP